ncbi:MAG TPA: hypothetical protein VJK03_03705 [Candidatus Nanoarchaeia archaeon]|nr:hypothetical protein [Candidatus Nanoarchaeia archaeon]
MYNITELRIPGFSDANIAYALVELSEFGRNAQILMDANVSPREIMAFHTETVTSDPTFPAASNPDLIVRQMGEQRYQIKYTSRVPLSVLNADSIEARLRQP